MGVCCSVEIAVRAILLGFVLIPGASVSLAAGLDSRTHLTAMGAASYRKGGSMRMLRALIAVAVLTAGSAQAQTYVVDTGSGATSGGTTLSENQWLAAKFTLAQAETISSIEGWMVYLNSLFSLPVDVVIYGDAGLEVPNTSDVRYQDSFTVLPSGFAPGWNGVTGISLDLPAGTYWVAFEITAPSVIGSGAMPPTAAQELPDYAFWTTAGGWSGNDGLNLGIRLGDGAAPEVPMASAGRWVLGAALLALGSVRLSRARAIRPSRSDEVLH